MKKILLIIFVIIGVSSLHSQTIPNASFENWTGGEPDTWGTDNATFAPIGAGPFVTQSTLAGDYNSGSSGIKLATLSFVNPFTSLSQNAPGIAVSDGTINVAVTPPAIAGGFPFTQNPDSLVGFTRYVNGGGDQGNIGVIFTKWNGTSRDTLGTAQYNPTNTTMARFAALVTWTLTGTPDTAQIILSSSGQVPAAGSELYVDDLDFAWVPFNPTVTTNAATGINSTSATLNGDLTNLGYPATIIEQGFYWSITSGNAVSSGTKVNVTPAGLGGFFSNITGLSPTTTYYYVAFAKNAAGTSYGTEISFTTPAPPPCSVNSSCTAPSCPDTLTVMNALINQSFTQSITLNIPTTAVTPFGTFPLDSVVINSFSNLPPGITVWGTECGISTQCKYTPGIHCLLLTGTPTAIGSYTINLNATGYAMGQSMVQTTHYLIGVTDTTAVTTAAATSITSSSAALNGNVTSDGNAALTEKGFFWSTTQGAAKSSGTKVITSPTGGTGAFTSNLTGLTPLTTYYYVAYSTNVNGTSYGSELSFSTTQVIGVPATISTNNVSRINSTSAKTGGDITNNGGTNITARGIVWDISPAPLTSLSTKTSNGTGVGTYTTNITGLLPGTTYYIRAYAVNSAGTTYGNELIYTTPAALSCTPDPSVTLSTPGIFPKSLAPFDTSNLVFNQTFTYSLPTNFTNEKGQAQVVDSSHLDNVLGLSAAGLTLQCGRPSCMYYPGEVACFTITGNLPAINNQVYDLVFVLTDYGTTQVSGAGLQVSQTYAPGYKADTVLVYVTSDNGFVGIEKLNVEQLTFIQSSPNPFNNFVTVRFNSPNSDLIHFSVTDLYGRDVYHNIIEANKGLNSFEYLANNIEAGSYYFTLSNGEQRVSKIMIKVQ